MQKDSNYQAYSSWLVKNVPEENIKYLIRLFLDKAALNMGGEVTEKTLNGSVEIVRQYYSYIPVAYVASGIIKGSLGHYGAGRLAPRAVYNWLGEITLEYNRDQAKEKLKSAESDMGITMNLQKYPIGKAIMQKIEWQKQGKLVGDDWDKVNLKQLTEDIAAGKRVLITDYI